MDLNPLSMLMQSVVFPLILVWLFHLNKFGIIALVILVLFSLIAWESCCSSTGLRNPLILYTAFWRKNGYWIEKQVDRVRQCRGIQKQVFYAVQEGPLKVFFPVVLWTVLGYLRKCVEVTKFHKMSEKKRRRKKEMLSSQWLTIH